MMIPEYICGNLKLLSASKIKNPIPLLPDIISTVIANIKDIARLILIPVTMLGDEAGKTILNKNWFRLSRKVFPVSISIRSILLTPSIVFIKIGQMQAKTITKIFILSSIPRKRIATGMIAAEGIGRRISTSGSNKL